MRFPIAVQVYSVREDAEKDLRGTLEKIKKMGYEGVEFAGLYGHSAEDVKKMCEEIGLVPLSAHIPYQDMAKDPEKAIADYITIGCKYVAVPYLVEEDRPGTPAWGTTVANVEMIGKVCKENGIKLLYHNHDFEFIKVGEKYALDMLYSTVPEDILATELDTCWVKVAGADPSYYIKKYSGRAPVVHLKDFMGEQSEDMYELIGLDKKVTGTDKFEFRPVGYGCQDFYSILTACESAGTEWVVVEQDRPSIGKTPLESIELSINYLKTF